MTEELTQEEREARAEQAERLRVDPAFQRAVIEIRKRAVEDLIKAPADNPTAIALLQAEVKAIDKLCGAIADEILRAKAQRKPPVV